MKDDTTMTFRGPDGVETPPITSKQLREVAKKMKTVALKREESTMYIPAELDFKENEYLESDDLQTLGEKLISDKFPDLKQWDIRLIWKKEGGKKNGKAVLGRTMLPRGFAAFYSKADVLVWAAADHLKFLRADAKTIEAVLYHEICHVQTDEDEKTGPFVFLIGHDFEGFGAELREYGAWRKDLEGMVETVKQLRLW